jgi:hypothetical protein
LSVEERAGTSVYKNGVPMKFALVIAEHLKLHMARQPPLGLEQRAA